MKTKTLILTSVLGFVGGVALMAQSTNIFSLNIVGYVNQSIPSGFSMIANQLNAGTNKVVSIFTTPPNNTQVFKFNGNGYDTITYLDGAWEAGEPSLLDMTLNPGDGVFIYTPTAFTNTFVGEIVLSSTNAVPKGFSIRSSVIPQTGEIDTVLGYVPGNNDSVYIYSGSGYKSWAYVDGAWETGESVPVPTPEVGQSFFIYNGGTTTKNWVRNFTVN